MTIENVKGQFSAYGKQFSFTINGEKHDLSHLVPEDVWNIGGRKFPLHPEDDWKMRKELRKIFIKYFKKNIDKNLKAKDVVF